MRIDENYIPLKITRDRHIRPSFEEVLDQVYTEYQLKQRVNKIGNASYLGSVDSKIMAEVKKASQKYGVPEELILAIIKQESSFNPQAYNKNKDGTEDRGLMQVNYQHNINLMKEYNVENPDQLYDIALNIEIGTRILYENYKRFGNWVMAVKAYNGLKANNWDYVKSVFEKVSMLR